MSRFIFYTTVLSWLLIIDILFMGFFADPNMKRFTIGFISFVSGYLTSRVDYKPSMWD